MKDEELVSLLRGAARDEAAGRDPRLEKLTLGELDPESARALEADAAGDEALARDLVLSRPLDEAARARMHARLMDAMNEAPRAELPRRAVEGRGATDGSLRARRNRRTWGAVAALALAAGVALAVSLRTEPSPVVARYEVAVESADVATRSATAAPSAGPLVQTAPRFELIARPTVAVAPPLVARAYAVHAGRVREWTTPVQLSADGAVKIAGPVADLFDDPRGTWDVVVAVGRPGFAAPPESALLGTADAVGGWRLVRARVELRPR